MSRCFGIVCLALWMSSGCATLAQDATPVSQSPRTSRLPVVHASEPTLERGKLTTRLAAYEQPDSLRIANLLFSGPTTVETLLQYATTNNPRIAVARAKANAMLAKVPQVRSLDDPILSTTALLEAIQTAAGPQDLMLSLSQKFPWFGKLDARGQIACHDAQVAFAEMANVELAVMEQVRLAYLDLYFIDQALDTYAELEQKLEDVVEVTRTRYETTKVGLESVFQVEVTLHKLQITVTELEQAKIKATARLAKAIHLPRGRQLEIEPRLNRTRLPRQIDSLVAMIEGCHPQLRGSQHAIERDRWSIQLARRNYYPDVNLGFNWYAIGQNGISPVANGSDAFALTAGINLPVYKGKRDAALREAQ